MPEASLFGSICAILGALGLYAASPWQKLAGHLPRPPCAAVGVAASVGAVACFMTAMGPTASVFVALTLVMTVWSLVPLALAYRRRHDAS